MGEVAGVPWSVFVTVTIVMFGFLVSIGVIALTNKTTLASEIRHNNERFIELKVEIEKKAAEAKIDMEKMRLEHNLEMEKIRDKKEENIIFFADSLAKFNTVLGEFKITMEGFKHTMQHVEKTQENLNTKMEKQDKKIEDLTKLRQRRS